MKSREVARQILSLIRKEHRKGNVLKKTIQEVWQSILDGNCIWITSNGKVVAAATLTVSEDYLQIGSLVVHKDFRGCGFASEVVARTIQLAKNKQSDRQIVAVAGTCAEKVFVKHGFVEHPKEEASEILWGGRSYDDWLNCDRKFMVLD